jgi:hypothetical protein
MTVRINASSAGLTETVDTTGILEFQTANTSALIIDASQNANFTSTGAITVPAGTTNNRPTGVNGMIRYNTTSAAFEYYVNNAWALANVTPPPVNTVAPVISGSAEVGANLTSTTGTWSFSPTSFAYQWRANTTAIANATANVFTLTSTQLGANITCNVTATNIAGSATATSNSLGPVVLNPNFTASYLVVAGGGNGGAAGPPGGGPSGGGGGGYLANSATFTVGTVYTMTVGAGGGSNSVLSGANLSTITSIGGGAGGGYLSSGSSGGSGGGGGSVTGYGEPTLFTAGGAGTAGQGNSGGGSQNYFAGGGGGGAGAAGDSGPSGGTGGNGLQSSITGTATYYAGGGGGSNYTPGLGGGGGVNTGGGGTGSSGGSGVIIISIPTSRYSANYTGANVVVTTNGSNTVVKFNSSGTYTA